MARWSDEEDRRMLLAFVEITGKIDYQRLSALLGDRTQRAVANRISALRKEAKAFDGKGNGRNKAAEKSALGNKGGSPKKEVNGDDKEFMVMPMARSWLVEKQEPESDE